MYRPKEVFNVAAELYNPSVVTSEYGVAKKTYSKVDDIFCSFKTYGGTETVSNGLLVVIDTAKVETWYRNDIKSDSQIRLNGKIYEVIGEPENIEMRNQFMKFKVQAVKGGA